MNKLTAHHFLYPLLALALVCCGVYIARQEIAVARAEERSKTHADAQKQIDSERVQNQQQLKTALDQLDAERKKPATVRTVTEYLPAPLPQGSTLKVETLPDSPTPQLVLSGDPQKNLDAIQSMELSHQACDLKLDACGKDKDLVAQKLTTMTADRDTWKDTAKGGSKMHRFIKVLKVTACAGGGAALGSFAGHRGAAIGGAAGAGGCSIFW